MSRPRSGTDGGVSESEMNDIEMADGTTYYFDENSAPPKYWWQHPKYKPIWVAGGVVLVGILLTTFFLVTLLGKHETITIVQLEYPETFKGKRGAVATDNRYCSELGVQILKEGGNAIDAAVASAICLGVRHPQSSGIGGGCVITIRLANGTEEVIDAREVAPNNAFTNMYQNASDSSVYGALAAAVPGELKGLEVAWQRYGSKKVSWERLFTDSIKMARDGFPIGQLLAEVLQQSQASMRQRKECNILPIFAPNGVIYNKGDKLKMEALANTLENVAKNGTWSFYNGPIAENMVKDQVEGGGSFILDDFKNYEVRIEKPLRGTYKGHEILCPGLPFSGCLILIETLNILEQYPDDYFKDSEEFPLGTHAFVESLKFAFANRVGLSDPEFAKDKELLNKIVDGMLSKEHAKELKAKIDLNKVFDPLYYVDLSPYTNGTKDGGTSHLSVIDSDRNAVSLTSTVNGHFGSKFMSSSTGVIFNNEMDDFSVPGQDNIFGVPPTEANYIVKGKRPVSSMVPVIFLEDDKPKFVLGASGGTTIPTSVLQVVLGVMEEGDELAGAIWSPRLHCQWLPNVVEVEANYDHYFHSVDSYQKLKAVGNNIQVINRSPSAVQGIWVDDDELEAVSDPRKYGTPSAY